MASLSKLAVLALVSLALPAFAQVTEADAVAPADSTQTLAPDSTETAPDSVASPRLGELLRRVAADAAEAQAQKALPEPAPEPVPTLHIFGSGLQVTLPAGWEGPESASEGNPGVVTYTFQNATPDHPLLGTAVRLERVTGLNALLRERWMRGQTAYGYHGTRPIGPATAPIPGFAVEVEGAGVRGITVFTQRGDGMWALHVAAPSASWTAHRDEIRALLTDIRLP